MISLWHNQIISRSLNRILSCNHYHIFHGKVLKRQQKSKAGNDRDNIITLTRN